MGILSFLWWLFLRRRPSAIFGRHTTPRRGPSENCRWSTVCCASNRWPVQTPRTATCGSSSNCDSAPWCSRHALEDDERPLHLGTHVGLGPAPALLSFIHTRFGHHAPRDHVLSIAHNGTNRFSLPPDILRHPQTFFSPLWSSSGSMCTSETEAAVEQTE